MLIVVWLLLLPSCGRASYGQKGFVGPHVHIFVELAELMPASLVVLHLTVMVVLLLHLTVMVLVLVLLDMVLYYVQNNHQQLVVHDDHDDG